MKRLVIVEAGEFAEVRFQHFTHDSVYEVAAFSAPARAVPDKSSQDTKT
jgi:hypothetical protein